jgi:IclR family pca regulon transcriptional regulator
VPDARRPPARESNQSLERGLAVLQVFSSEQTDLTLSDVARLSGTTRATARRILLTLEELGHVHSDGRRFALTPRVLALGWAYLSALNLPATALPLMRRLAETTGESCSLATIDGDEVVYVARVPAQRIMTISLGVGSRLPAYATSMGRVLLASLPDEEMEALLAAHELEPLTSETVTDRSRLAEELATVRGQGWAIVDGELELGLRSAAAPVRDAGGRVVAALNTSVAAARVSREQIETELLPRLLATAGEISAALAAVQHGFVSAGSTRAD